MHFYSKLSLFFKLFFIILLLSLPVISQAAHYHEVSVFKPWKDGKGLGSYVMPVTTNSDAAKQYFQTGIRLYHAYEFSEAIWSFREAQRLDPKFAMAYWGEVMSNYMFVWYAFDAEKAKVALEKMDENADLQNISDVEKSLIEMARILVSASANIKDVPPYDKKSALWKVRKKMEEIYDKYPNDPDIKVFYGYSILGTRKGIRDFKTNGEAIAFFQNVIKEHPEHIGALHYLLHAAENPVQAYLSHQAAEAMSNVAPAAIHALHMPAHYYFPKGDWEKVVDINRHGWSESIKRAKDVNAPSDSYEFHGYGWIVYGLLQQGKFNEALRELNVLYKLYEDEPSSLKLKYLAFARAGFLVDSPYDSNEREHIRQKPIKHGKDVSSSIAANIFATGYDAWQSGNKDLFKNSVHDYKNQYDRLINSDFSIISPPDNDAVIIMNELMKGLDQLMQGNEEKAEEYFIHAGYLEDNMVHEHGIPLVVKPANELYADFLLAKKRAGEASYYYDRSLLYQPGRLSALQGKSEAEVIISKQEG